MKHTIRVINRISALTARVLDRRFPDIRHLGLDIAVDTNGRVWIIEANSNPSFQTFKQLRIKTMYKRIVKRRRFIYAKYQ